MNDPNINVKLEINEEIQNVDDEFDEHDFLFCEIEDFNIICQNQVFKFSKQYLSMISPVFKNMMKNTYIESKNNTLKIEDVEPEIIQAFKNVLYHDSISEENLTPQLLMFAQRYLIEPLIDICRNKLVKNLSKENFVDAIIAAYWNDDQELLKFGVEYILQNIGKFKNNPELDSFLKAHPDFSVKIMNMKNNCRNELVKNLSKEKFVGAIKAAYWNEDEELLKFGVEYAVLNIGTFINNPEFDSFLNAHPDFSVRIMNMMNICRNKLVRNLSKENYVDFFKAAYWNDDQELWKIGVDYIIENRGSFDYSTELNDFMESHPDFSQKFMKVLMYKK